MVFLLLNGVEEKTTHGSSPPFSNKDSVSWDMYKPTAGVIALAASYFAVQKLNMSCMYMINSQDKVSRAGNSERS